MSRALIIQWAVVFTLLIVTAVHQVKQRHTARNLYHSLQQLEKQRDNLQARWSQLTLEKGVVLGQLKTEKLAQNTLKMFYPDWSNIRTIKLNHRQVDAEKGTAADVDADKETQSRTGALNHE